MGIHFKDLDVYRLALDFVELCAAIAKRIPRGQGQMADQLRRASSSSAYNTGEGAGEFAPKEKARFYRIALRSTTESSTIIDIVHRLGFIDAALHARAETVAERLIGMLTKLVHRHQAVFGRAPEVYGFDRGGYCPSNMSKARELGVKHVGIAPKGQAPWSVGGSMRKRIRRERAHVEGSIGTLKSSCYGFNKPRARSSAAMERCGHRAILGFNLRKMTREWAAANQAAAIM